jgi:hypothetical protein
LEIQIIKGHNPNRTPGTKQIKKKKQKKKKTKPQAQPKIKTNQPQQPDNNPTQIEQY